MTALTVIDTLRQLQHLGRKVSSDGKQLHVGPGGEMSVELAEAVREHRDELVRLCTPPPEPRPVPPVDEERQAIQWAERRPNAEADAALAAAVEDWRENAFIVAAANIFKPSAMRLLTEQEYDAIGFRVKQAKPTRAHSVDSGVA